MTNSNSPTAYYLRNPMHCGVYQFLQFPGGVFECSHYPKGLVNPPVEEGFGFEFHGSGQSPIQMTIRRNDALPLMTARAVWTRLVECGYRWDGSSVLMTDWNRVSH